MRQTLIILTFVLTLISCNNADTTKATINTQSEQQADTAKSRRHFLIEELKNLHQIVASNDKERISGIFEFPLTDTSFSIYVDDSTYNEQFNANGNRTTKAMFLQHFKEISDNIWLDQLKNLFQHINLDSLLHKETAEHEAYIKTAPCFYSYKIEVIKDSVILRMDMNSNRTYKSKKSSEDDMPENSSEICEHSFWWNFIFDGRKLHFKNIAGAG